MVRFACWIVPSILILACGCGAGTPAFAAPRHKVSRKHTDSGAEKAKPVQLATYGDWGAFVAEVGKDKTCYALAQPKERAPANLHRDPAYIFISDRPAENIRDEVSIIMGFPMKDGGDAEAEVGSADFALISKGTNAWVKNPAKESEMINAMKRGATLIVKAASTRGNMTTDSYSLTGLSQALERVQKECR